MSKTDEVGFPKLDKTGVLPEDAQLVEFPDIQDGQIMLAIDDEGNVFNLGKKPALYVVEDPEAE